MREAGHLPDQFRPLYERSSCSQSERAGWRVLPIFEVGVAIECEDDVVEAVVNPLFIPWAYQLSAQMPLER